jgi:GT2 family glycosyltransferase
VPKANASFIVLHEQTFPTQAAVNTTTRSRTRNFKAPTIIERAKAHAALNFSVVIAVHNAESTIAGAIDSVLAQTVAPLELIVCDDGSTDGTEEAVRTYREGLTYLRKHHGGVASARNAALELASGEFFAVLDADDVFEPERLEALTELALERPDLDVLCTDAVLEEDGRAVGTFIATCPFETVDQKAAILERCFCIAPAVRRETLVTVGGFDESLRSGSDWECAIRLLHSGARAGLVEEPLYRYRVEGTTLTSDRVATLRDRLLFLERIEKSDNLVGAEAAALERSLAAQRSALVLTEAEAALRSRAHDGRRRAFAVARSSGVSLGQRAAAVAATLAPRTAARILDRRAQKTGRSRLARSLPR